MTKTEAAIHELEKLSTKVVAQMDYLSRDADRFRHDLVRIGDTLKQLETRLAVVESQVADLRKALEVKEQRQWQFWLLFLGSLLTLVGNIVVIFLGRR